MPVLREQDFDKMATEVVDRFFTGQAKLADAAAEMAGSHGLNPDQIERLVQAANTMTFLRGMEQRKQEGAGDLLHEFDPIDARHVIRIVIDGAGAHVMPDGEEQGHGDEMELPDEMSGMHMNPAEGEPGHEDSPEVEECEEKCHDKLDPPGVKTKKKYEPDDEADEAAPPSKEARIMRAQKLAGILEDQYRQAEWAYEERFDALASRFKRVYNPMSFEAFEKDAMAEFGDEVGLTILNGLRAARKLPALEKQAAFEKTAALQDRHITIESPELHLFEELHQIATKAAQLSDGIAWVKTQCA